MDNKTRELLRELQNGFKLETRPFKRIAKQLNCSEQEVIEIISKCRDEGIIRRIGAAVRPEKAGHNYNVLVAWQIEEDKIEQVASELSKVRCISHCYERECPQDWPYNLFTMIHSRDKDEFDSLIEDIKTNHNLNNYKCFPTIKELKKTSMKYFKQDD